MNTLGLDLLAFAHPKFPRTLTLTMLPKGWAIGIFDSVFGDALRALRKELKAHPEFINKIAAVRVHLYYNDKHTICPLSVISDRAPKWDKFAREYPSIKILLSHSCEHDEKSNTKVYNRMKLLNKFAPHCLAVNCPNKGFSIPFGLKERHMPFANSGESITSTDGVSLTAINAAEWNKLHKKTTIRFGWTWSYNGLPDGIKPGQPRPAYKDRTNWPNKQTLKEMILLLKIKA